jgi:hypothetical protein
MAVRCVMLRGLRRVMMPLLISVLAGSALMLLLVRWI